MHLVDMYQTSLQKEKNIKMNYAISVDNTHKDVSDFFENYDENTTYLIGDGDSHID